MNIFARLGGFHLIMSYMGSIGSIISRSGLQEQWKTVYVPHFVRHMLTGHAYAPALRAHMLSAAAVVSEMLHTPNCLDGVDLNRLNTLNKMLLNDGCNQETLLHEHNLKQVT